MLATFDDFGRAGIEGVGGVGRKHVLKLVFDALGQGVLDLWV